MVGVAQLVEHLVVVQEVAGSSPVTHPKHIPCSSGVRGGFCPLVLHSVSTSLCLKAARTDDVVATEHHSVVTTASLHTLAMAHDTSPRRMVLLVEDHTALRVALAELLQGRNFDVADVGSAHEALSSFSHIDPDVLVVDVDLGDRPNGVELATIIRAKAPYVGVVFLTDYPTLDAIERVGSVPDGSAFLTKSLLESADDLIEAIDSALDDSAASKVKANENSSNPIHSLTAAQIAVARLIALGLTNVEIARQRGSSLRGVEQLIARTFDALGVTNDPNRNPRVVTAMLYAQAFGQPSPSSER